MAAQNALAKLTARGEIGIWSASARFAPDRAGVVAAQELERLGFSALWIPGALDSGVLQALDDLLDATSSILLGSSILNIWKHRPVEIAAWWEKQQPRERNRLVLGLGVSHGPLIGEPYGRPLEKMRAYLDALEDAGMELRSACLGGLGPKMLELAGQRTGGACPYLVTPRHSAQARAIMGPNALLAPEQGVVIETDPLVARALAREALKGYSALPNYTNSWLREGFTQEDIANVSDRLIDGLIAWGDMPAIAQRIREHLDAGANHVSLQVIGEGDFMRPISADLKDWAALSRLL